MTDLTQYTSPTVDGLQVVIDHQTGKVYVSQKALARLIGKSDIYVRRHAKSGFYRLDATILTPGGLQIAKLYDEDFICSLLVKHNYSDLAKVCKLGIRDYLKELVGLLPTTPPINTPSSETGTSKPCYCYIFEDESMGQIKVGITSNIKRRYASLECASGRDLTLRYSRKYSNKQDALTQERILHNRLKDYRLNGEWFNIAYSDLPPNIVKLLKLPQ